MSVSDWSTNAGDNAALGFAEGQAPGTLNDSIRGVLADGRAQFNQGPWFNYRDGTPDGTYAYVSATSFKVSGTGNQTAKYAEDCRVRATGTSTGTIYGTITGSSYSAPDTTVVVDWDSGSLVNETLVISLSMVEPLAVPGTSSTAISLGTSGYYTLPGGLLVQWGVDTTLQHGRSVSFPVPFLFSCFGVYPSLRFGSAGFLTGVKVDYAEATVAGFKQVVLSLVTGSTASGDITSGDYTYIAIGV